MKRTLHPLQEAVHKAAPRFWGDFFGAFADAAVLFPLIALITQKCGFSGPVLFATAGLAYLAAGFTFRVPMSVQPLKSVAIGALAIGATWSEVRVAAFSVGAICLGLSFFRINKSA